MLDGEESEDSGPVLRVGNSKRKKRLPTVSRKVPGQLSELQE